MIRVLALGLTLLVMGSASIAVASSTGSDAREAAAGSFCGRPTFPVDEASPPIKVHLGIGKTAVRSGGVVRVRIENFGTSDLSYDFGYELARRQGGLWVKLPPRPIYAPRLSLDAGSASACQSIDIPRGATPGRYRITKGVRPRVAGQSEEVFVRATFWVRG